MSVRMKLSFTSPVPDDHDKSFLDGSTGGTLEERKAAFKKDEELMKETTKFVSEVIETATLEANRRAEQVSFSFLFICTGESFEASFSFQIKKTRSTSIFTDE